jgi:hypothetical protein
VFGCALMRARAGTANLPYGRHLLAVTFCAWRLSSLQRLTCCNAPSELFGFGLRAGVAGACVAVLSVGCGLEEEGGCECRGRAGLCLGVH